MKEINSISSSSTVGYAPVGVR